MPKYLILDYETFSECDIRESGAYEYAAHQSTEILCVGYTYGTREELRDSDVHLFTPRFESVARDTEFVRLLTDSETVLVAHNAFFEQCITKLVLPRYRNLLGSNKARTIDPEHWICTASLARAVGIPGNLEGASAALNLAHQKDMEGHRLMLKMCKPRKPTKNDASTRHTDPDDLKRLYEYCKKDIEAERELFLRLPPLHQKERKFWVLNQKMNLRGFAIDRELVTGALHCIDKEVKQLDGRFRELTGLNSARQRDATLKVLAKLGLTLSDLKAGTIDEALKGDFYADPEAKEMLEIRQAISKSSTAKYSAFEARSRSDGRARDNTIYFGAHTGRDSGTGLQPQNLFKATMPLADVLTGIDLIKARDVTAIQALYPKPMELYASALRSCIVAPNGYVLDVGDFSTVEVRVLFWLAGHQKGLAAILSGKDLYTEMAGKIYEEDEKQIFLEYKSGSYAGLQKRQLGKQTVLGAGFGIGVGGEKFQKAAKAYGMDISISLAQKAVIAYRELHAPVVKFWSTIERAATLAIQNPGKTYRHGVLRWRKDGDWLHCQLPLGRNLSYYKPRIERVNSLYGEKLSITYRGVESVSKKFIRMTTWGGKLTENVVQGAARDLLMESLLRLDEEGHAPVLAVHDEIVCERYAEWNFGEVMRHLMEKAPAWAEGLPIKVEGWSETRYRK